MGKKSEHKCATDDCANTCPRAYPFCAPCWRRVPFEMRKDVRAALKQSGTDEQGGNEIYLAVTAAAAAVREVNSLTPEAAAWDEIYRAAGSPDINTSEESDHRRKIYAN